MRTLKCLILILSVLQVKAQQVEDSSFSYPIPRPQYEKGKGTLIVLDEAHDNFHTVSGRYRPFARLLRADGYRVSGGTRKFTKGYLDTIKILVISNATDNREWVLPTKSAFTNKEIISLNSWVKNGGSLFLIADHMPMAGAAAELAASFGFGFLNGFAFRTDTVKREWFTRAGKNLHASIITDGRTPEERVDSIVCFTGQGFTIPGSDSNVSRRKRRIPAESAERGKDSALAIMSLGENYEVLMPDTAWRFSKNTPRVSGKDLVNGAFMNYGKGRLVVFGEAAMFSAQMDAASKRKAGMNHPAAKYNARLLLNIVHWLDKKF